MLASSAAPDNALKIWTDGSRIYVELPGSPGHSPYVVWYYYSEGGLGKALSLLAANKVRYDYIDTIPEDYRKPTKGRQASELERAQVDAMLLRLGIIK